ncbi:MAG: NUDIX domain-containing protein [Candidatus Pacebacteria bacterium]|nr:NUDIX domain-containing protein [Candidatus Paceibacterota bacterium]
MDGYEICARALIRKEGKVLVCRFKGKNFYFFPGGHVEFSEKAEDALRRELKEELDLEIEEMEYMGTVENIYEEDGDKHHEINLVFGVEVKGEVTDKSMEDDLEFFFLDQTDFSKEKVLPLAMRDSVDQWLKDGRIFWASQFDGSCN